MLTKHLTMRASLSLTIVIMGLLGLALALATGEVYRRQTLDKQRAAMAELLRLKTDDLLRELEAKPLHGPGKGKLRGRPRPGPSG